MPLKPAKPVDPTGTKGHAAGTIFVGPSGDILLLHRSSIEKNYAGHWCWPGGGVDKGESPESGATREAREELGDMAPTGRKRLLDQRRTPNDLIFSTFAQACPSNFAPMLNAEHSGFTWAALDHLPGPLHPSVEATLKDCRVKDGLELAEWADEEVSTEEQLEELLAETEGEMAMDELFAALASEIEAQRGPVLAFDRAPDGLRGGITVKLAFDRDTSQGRTVDGFERLHVKRVPITKACVSPYYGREIPKGQELGLHPDRVYRLLRDPDEIKKGAATSHNVPLLSKHVPHSADEHDGDITVGTVGSQAEYAHPYLYNSLAVWNREGRDHVESGSQKELSSAYGYDADMTPGNYEGEPYDGVMRNMKWNHVCLVKKGRAGSDVALDEALQPPKETTTMATKIKSMKATVAYGALTTFLKPKLAMDAAMPNIGKALGTFEPGKFKQSIPAFVSALRNSLGKLKLAQDADLAGVVDGVQKLMASIDGDKTVEDGELERDPNEIDSNVDLDGDDTSMDAGGGMEAVIAYLKSKGVPDDVIAGMPGTEAPASAEDAEIEGETPEQKAARLAKAGAKDALPPPTDGKKPDFVSKGAMDAALRSVEASTIARMHAVSEARDHVKPIVGELPGMAFDSAEGVYRKAFAMHGQDVSKIKGTGATEALRQMWDMIPGPGARKEPIAQDAASNDDFKTMFPNAAKVKKA